MRTDQVQEKLPASQCRLRHDHVRGTAVVNQVEPLLHVVTVPTPADRTAIALGGVVKVPVRTRPELLPGTGS
jgi:hypothetical protein